jgi:hypothetical protein
MPSLYWLCYRVDGHFVGLVLLEADSRAHACLRAELEHLNPGGQCESYEIGETEARAIPSRFIGVVLGKDEVAELEKIIVTNAPKRPPAPSSQEDAAAQETA